MKRFTQWITESPDEYSDDDLNLYWSDDDAVTFFIEGNALIYTTTPAITHTEIALKLSLMRLGEEEFQQELLDNDYYINGDEIWNEDIMTSFSKLESFNIKILGESPKFTSLFRDDYDISGRLWKTDNILSTWTGNVFDIKRNLNLLKTMFKSINVDINQTLFELGHSNPISYETLTTSDTRYKDIKHKAHTLNNGKWKQGIKEI